MRQGTKIIGLALLAALSLMVTTATAAQAEPGELQIEGKTVAEGEEVPIVGTGGSYKSLIPGLKLELKCEGVEISGTVTNLKIGATKRAHGKSGKVLFFGCQVVGNKFCKIYPTEADRNAKTNAGHISAGGLISERLITSTRHYLEAVPTGKAFATVFYTKAAEGCVLPTVELTGRAALKVPNATEEAENHTVEVITKAEEEELKVGLFYGAEPMIIDEVTGLAHLDGAFKGKKFSLTEK